MKFRPKLPMDFICGGLTSFLVSLFYTWAGLAPSLSFEDSGEMILAAHAYGVPHPPGYPLNTILGSLFLKLPFGTPAYRMNFMSAFFASLASLTMFLILYRMLTEATTKKERVYSWSLSLLGSLFVIGLPTYYRQSIITEVYGLNCFLSSLIILGTVDLLLTSKASNCSIGNKFNLMAFVSGLSISNHHTSMLLIAPLAASSFFFYRHWLSLKKLILMSVFFILGLSPYLYLPWSASRSPLLNWGDPSNWKNFIGVVTRAQYHPQINDSWSGAIEQVRLQLQLFVNQVPFVALVLGMGGLLLLWRIHRQIGSALALSLICTGPITAYLVNFEVRWDNYLYMKDVSGLVSVFYLVFYLLWCLPAVFCIYRVILWLLNSPEKSDSLPSFKYKLAFKKVIPAALLLAFITSLIFQFQKTYELEGKQNYTAVDEMFVNLQKITQEPAIVFVNWDPFSFPALYYQHVLGQFKNFIFFDLELLKTFWYLDHLKKWYPDFFKKIEESAKKYEIVNRSVYSLQSDKQDEMELITNRYFALVSEVIRVGLKRGRVFAMINPLFQPLPPQAFSPYAFHSQLVALEMTNPEQLPKSWLSAQDFDISAFTKKGKTQDRMMDMIAQYYLSLMKGRYETIQASDYAARITLLQKMKGLANSNQDSLQIESEISKVKKLESK